MRFTVPKFIEREAKIIGPLTFKQFVFFGIAGTIGLILYYSVSFSLFLISAVILGGGAFAFAFVNIGGRSILTILGNFLKFNLAPKIYIWKKIDSPAKVFEKEIKEAKRVEKKDELPLKIAANSQLKKLQTRIETKTK